MQKIKNTYSRKHSIFKRELCKLVQLYYLARCESVSDNKSSFPHKQKEKAQDWATLARRSNRLQQISNKSMEWLLQLSGTKSGRDKYDEFISHRVYLRLLKQGDER